MAKAGQETEEDDEDQTSSYVQLVQNILGTLILLRKPAEATQLAIQASTTFSNGLLHNYLSSEDDDDIDADDTTGIMVAVFIAKVIPDAVDQSQRERLVGMFRKHVEREIDLALEYEFKVGRDMMEINDTEEEGLLFELPNKDLVLADAKEAVMTRWEEQEKLVIREVAQ